MLKYIYSFFYDYEEQTLTPNSMSIIPSHKFINHARIKVDPDEDDEPHKNYKEYIATQEQHLDNLVDYWNH